MIETVKSEITKAFNKISVKHNIDILKLRVKITMFGNKLDYVILNKVEHIEETTLSGLIGFLGAIAAEGKLINSVQTVINENQLNKETANVRLYMADENTPSAYLYNHIKPVKQIDIATLLN